jgi:hypothetical protein
VTTMRLHWRNSATAAQVRPLDHRLPSDKVSRRRDRPTAWSISAIPTRTEPLVKEAVRNLMPWHGSETRVGGRRAGRR